eukprot:3271086-Ditylum_brightwellii.AAC.1
MAPPSSSSSLEEEASSSSCIHMKKHEGIILLLDVSVMVGILEDEVHWVVDLALVVVIMFGLVDSL